MMRDVLATHRDVGLLGIRHRSWMIVLGVLVFVQFVFLIRSGSPDPLVGSLQLFVKSVATRRVCIVMPLHSDQTKALSKRFSSWNDKRFPCANKREHHMMDFLFYLGPNANANQVVIDAFMKSEARKCFRNVEIIKAVPLPPGLTESEVSRKRIIIFFLNKQKKKKIRKRILFIGCLNTIPCVTGKKKKKKKKKKRKFKQFLLFCLGTMCFFTCLLVFRK
jgi:hypothetical protein